MSARLNPYPDAISAAIDPDEVLPFHQVIGWDEMAAALAVAGIPYQLPGNARARRAFRPHADSVKLMNRHSSKGLEFPMVAVTGVGYLPVRQAEPADEARLPYVAMTRATENLLLTTHRETPFIDQLRQRQPEDEPPHPAAPSDGETRCMV